MNSLFSEFFTKFGGVFLCETISGGIWEVFGGKVEENKEGRGEMDEEE